MLSHEIVEEIGNKIGFIYTNYNGYSNIPDDVSDGESFYSGSAFLSDSTGSRPHLLIFKPFLFSYFENKNKINKTRSIYVLNLNTLKPTKTSYKQTELSEKLKNKIKNEISIF